MTRIQVAILAKKIIPEPANLGAPFRAFEHYKVLNVCIKITFPAKPADSFQLAKIFAPSSFAPDCSRCDSASKAGSLCRPRLVPNVNLLETIFCFLNWHLQWIMPHLEQRNQPQLLLRCLRQIFFRRNWILFRCKERLEVSIDKFESFQGIWYY